MGEDKKALLVVQKYGGTSVATLERIRMVARRVKESRDDGKGVVVVVSAQAGETERLVRLAEGFDAADADRETDVIVSTGEQVSAGLLSLALLELGVRARSLLPFQIPLITDGVYRRGRIISIAADTIKRLVEEGLIPVIPGFFGISENLDITTLGRGSSDTVAVAVAAAIGADLCEICSDVDGVYTADPKICHNAKKIDRISYEEMLEIAGSGAKVVEMRAVELAAKHRLPIHIASSFSRKDGTWVLSHQTLEAPVVSAITHTLDEAKIAVRRVPDYAGLAAHVFEPLARENINVDMIVQNISADERTDIAFTVSKHALKRALAITERAAARIGAERVEAAGDVAKISIIGLGMISHAGVAAKMFDTLRKEGIGIHLISTSEIKVSVVVDMKDVERAVSSLHSAFGLA